MDRDLGYKAGTVWSFERVSHAMQTSGVGMERQGLGAIEYCRKHGLVLAEERGLSDPGKSAFHGRHMRKGSPLRQFIELAEKRLVGADPVLLIENVDRLTRMELIDALDRVFLKLIRAGVTIVSLHDEKFYNESNCNDLEGFLPLILYIKAARQYSDALSKRQKFNWTKVRDKARNGDVVRKKQQAPSWCTWNKKTETFELNEKAQSVRRAFELLRNHGYMYTANILNQEKLPGLRTPGWTVSKLSTLIRRAYQVYGAVAIREAGSWKQHERDEETGRRLENTRVSRGAVGESLELIEGVFPAVLPRSEVEQVLAVIRLRDQNKAHPGPMSRMHWIGKGITICNHCGGHCSTAVGGQVHTKPIRYLSCNSKRHGRTDCDAKYIDMKAVEATLLSRLTIKQLQLMTGEKNSDQVAIDLQAKIRELKGQEDGLKLAIENLGVALTGAAERGTYEIEMPILTKKIKERQAELLNLSDQISEHQNQLSKETNPLALSAVHELIQPLRLKLIDGDSSGEERYQINAALKQMGITLHLDSKPTEHGKPARLGIRVGKAPISWGIIDKDIAIDTIRNEDFGMDYSERSDVKMALG